MPIGQGKYDKLCTKAREQAKAIAAILMIIDGKRGSGFSVQGPLEITSILPRVLRDTADQIEADLKEGKI